MAIAKADEKALEVVFRGKTCTKHGEILVVGSRNERRMPSLDFLNDIESFKIRGIKAGGK
jgi:hypothetical protein